MPVTTDGTTFINGIGLGFTLLICVLMLVLPRRYALVPVIILTCYMTMGERIMVAGANFTMIRILTLVGWMRIIVQGEIRSLRLNPIDKVMMAWVISSVMMYTLLWQTGQAFINRVGFAYDTFGLYFLFRFLIRDLNDIKRTVRILAILIVPLAIAMLAEKLTGRNVFAVFGGVMEFTRIRDGSLRCQGPFAHPILAGSFGATLLPLFVGLWFQGKKNHLIAGLAVISAVSITVTSASSGPFLAAIAGMVGLLAWQRRQWLRTIRWGTLLGLIALQLKMKAPVWFLIARADVFGGSTGWHRAALIDAAVRHFGDWWLVGVKDTGYWSGDTHLLADVTNEYVWQGVQGGLLTLLLFVLMIVFCFRGVGRTTRLMRGRWPHPDLLCTWSLGAAMFAHVFNYLSITYFDQNFVNWYLLLSMTSTAAGAYVFSQPRVSAADREPSAEAAAVEVGAANSWSSQIPAETAPSESGGAVSGLM
jgi:hypothetical protein